jgi:hypothetical protein
MNMKQRSCDGWGGAQRPVWRGNAPKKTGAHSARARTRGQNTLVFNNHFYENFYKTKRRSGRIVPSRAWVQASEETITLSPDKRY